MTYGGGTDTHTDTPQWFDSLGPSSINGKKQTFTPTGGVPERSDIFARMDATKPTVDAATGRVVAGLQTAADDPGWGAGQDLARRTIAGDYLNGSPQLDAAMAANRRQQLDSAADASARNASGLARNGMGFSTANQQADASTRAAAAAAAGSTEAAARLANYEQERTRQTQGVDALQNATSAPLNYLQNISSAEINPLAQEASLVSGLSTGGPVATPNSTIIKQPGAADYAQGILSAY